MNHNKKNIFNKILVLSTIGFISISGLVSAPAQAETSSGPFTSPFDKPYTRMHVVPKANQPFQATEELTKQFSIYFDNNETDLTPDQYNSLSSIIALTNDHKYEVHSIDIIGHTDNTGSNKTNYIIGKKRATSIAAYLSSKGVDKDLLNVSSDGKLNPIALNSSYLGKGENRRVDIFVNFK